MGEWSPSLASPATRDFLSLYTSRTQRSPRSQSSSASPRTLAQAPSQHSPRTLAQASSQHSPCTLAQASSQHSPRTTAQAPYRMGSAELCFSPPPGSPRAPSEEDDGLFCNRRNVDECVSYLNKEVMVLGMPSLYEGRSQTFDIVRLVNNTYELLNKHQGSILRREDLQTKLQRVECDLREVQNTNHELKATIEQLQRDLAGMQEKERQATSRNKALSSNLKAERDETKRLQSDMQHKQSQFRHEVRKKEKENHKLKERLHGALTDKNKDKKLGLQISQLLHRVDNKRGTWANDNRHEEEAYREVIISYEARQKQLLVENSGMRQCLNNLQKELISLLNAPDDPPQPNGKPHTQALNHDTETELSDIDELESLIGLQTGTKEDLSEAHFQMPYDLVGDSIEKGLTEKLKIIKRLLRQSKKSEIDTPRSGTSECASLPPDSEALKELEKLNKQVERYREIVDQQEKLIQESLSDGRPGGGVEILEESDLWEEKEQIQREKSRIKEQQKNFDSERRNFTDAAIRLSKERQQFEEEKARFAQQQFLRITPLNTRKQTPIFHGGERLVHVTPRLSPAAWGRPSSRGKTPSTAELYRTLGLVPLGEREESEGFSSPDLKGESSSDRSPRLSRRAVTSRVSEEQSPSSSPRSSKGRTERVSSTLMTSSPESHVSGTTASNSSASSSEYILARTEPQDESPRAGPQGGSPHESPRAGAPGGSPRDSPHESPRAGPLGGSPCNSPLGGSPRSARRRWSTRTEPQEGFLTARRTWDGDDAPKSTEERGRSTVEGGSVECHPPVQYQSDALESCEDA